MRSGLTLIFCALICSTLSSRALAQDTHNAPSVSLSGLLALPDADAEAALDGSLKAPGAAAQGWTAKGTLRRGRPLHLKDPSLGLLPNYLERDRHYGSATMTRFLLDSARRVAKRHPGARLLSGELSARDGGKISGHASHRNGLDVDLALFYVDRRGRPVEADSMRKADRRGDVEGGLKFDVERNWTMVEVMLTHPEAQVQYLFIYNPLKRMLLEHARSIGADPEIIRRASYMMLQPANSSPHRDHFHVRLYCSSAERLDRCLNRGPNWPWAHQHRGAVGIRALRLLELIDAQPERTADAARYLGRIEARHALAALTTRLPGADAAGREAILDVLENLGPTRATAAPLAAALASLDDAQKNRAIALLGRAGREGVGALARVATQDPSRAVPATNALVRRVATDSVPMWIENLESEDPQIRGVSLWALHIMSNRVGAAANLWRADAAERVRVADTWRRWWDEHRDEPQAEWLLSGYQDYQPDISGINIASIPGLIALQNDDVPPFLATNANQSLGALTRHSVPLSLKPKKRHRRWKKWWSKNKKRFKNR